MAVAARDGLSKGFGFSNVDTSLLLFVHSPWCSRGAKLASCDSLKPVSCTQSGLSALLLSAACSACCKLSSKVSCKLSHQALVVHMVALPSFVKYRMLMIVFYIVRQGISVAFESCSRTKVWRQLHRDVSWVQTLVSRWHPML